VEADIREADAEREGRVETAVKVENVVGEEDVGKEGGEKEDIVGGVFEEGNAIVGLSFIAVVGNDFAVVGAGVAVLTSPLFEAALKNCC
jgi:hypothetical protein